ncbi:MAG: hypothetical protein IIB44_05730 [Candidatus Marinimicrobia bacterium]|nr:hypothetical protein [Candidatus Neomarinimicrobiota bacterium]MCH8068018.1 hypothetical protein [Candidatus Neomarinimicrobiota bacterium]
MKRIDINYVLAILLLLSIIVTGTLGYIQSQLELRKFVPHRYSAYITLSLAAVHVFLNIGKVWRYFRRKVRKK